MTTPTEELSIEDTGVSLARVIRRRDKSAGDCDPYRGTLASKPASRKKDLRKLGAWLEAKRRAEEMKKEEAESAPDTDPEDSKKRSR